MVVIRNDCCDCATESYPCLGNLCPLRRHEVIICDECGSDDECVYEYDGVDLCERCMRKQYPEDFEELND